MEAFFENKDIGFVNAGQEAEVKIETFQYTKYGTLDAEVSSASRDTINDEKRGLIYSSRVRMAKTTLLVDGTEVSLSPGMAVTVEVKTGWRRVIPCHPGPAALVLLSRSRICRRVATGMGAEAVRPTSSMCRSSCSSNIDLGQVIRAHRPGY